MVRGRSALRGFGARSGERSDRLGGGETTRVSPGRRQVSAVSSLLGPHV